jgi:hypothetical protein
MNSKYKIIENKLFFILLFSSCKNENNQNGKIKENQPVISESKVDLKNTDPEVIKEYIKNLSEEEFEKVTGVCKHPKIKDFYQKISKENFLKKEIFFKNYESEQLILWELFFEELYKNELSNTKIKIYKKEYSLYEFLDIAFNQKKITKGIEIKKNDSHSYDILIENYSSIKDIFNLSYLREIGFEDLIVDRGIKHKNLINYGFHVFESLDCRYEDIFTNENLDNIYPKIYLELEVNFNGIINCCLSLEFFDKISDSHLLTVTAKNLLLK